MMKSLLYFILASTVAIPSYAQFARAYVDRDSVTVGQRFSLIVAVDQAPSDQLFFLPSNADPSLFGDLEVLSRTDPQRHVSDAGVQTDSVLYEVATFALDTAFVPPIPIAFLSGSDTTALSTSSFIIPVISLVPADAEGIKDLAPLAEFPRSIWPWFLALLLAAGAGYLFYRYRQQAPLPEPEPVIIEPQKPQISPYDLAIQQLNELGKTYNLNDNTHIKPYYVGLSDILRTYLFGRIKVPAMEMTTREILYHLERRITGKLIPRQVSRLTRRILDVSDLVKFADMEPPAEVGEQAMEESRTLLEIVEKAMKPRVERPAAPEPSEPSDEQPSPPAEPLPTQSTNGT